MNQDIAGRCILVVEDEYFIARDIVQEFQAQGARVIGPIASAESALAVLNEEEIDGAVLDIKLRDSTSYTLADRLLSKNIPFLFSTGYDPLAIPAAYSDIVVCEKPVDAPAVATALKALFPHAHGRVDKLTYRVLREGATWHWRLYRNGALVAQGTRSSRANAMAAAILAGLPRPH